MVTDFGSDIHCFPSSSGLESQADEATRLRRPTGHSASANHLIRVASPTDSQSGRLRSPHRASPAAGGPM